MKYNILPLNLKSNIELEELNYFIKKNITFNGDPFVFQRDENSDSVTIAKPCTQEFFEKVFDAKGPFWSVYFKSGLATKFENAKYITFICGQMYFLKNIENVFISNPSSRKSFKIDNEKLYENEEKNQLNANGLLSSVKKFINKISFSILANEAISEFEKFKVESEKYYSQYSDRENISNPIETAKKSLELAIESMVYSYFALLSYKLKIKLKKSKSIEICESDELDKLVMKGDTDSVKEKFGFYSLAPYDISFERFSDNAFELKKYGSFACPINYAMRWRENAKFIAARYLQIQRIALQKFGEITGLDYLVFYLKISEIENININNKEQISLLRELSEKRRDIFEGYKQLKLPLKIIYFSDKLYKIDNSVDSDSDKEIIKALSVSSKEVVIGPAININSFDDFKDFKKGSIIISKALSPNLAILIRKSAGIVSENGSSLSHVSIIAREACVPCFVQAKIDSKIKNGQYLELNGINGEIKIVDKPFFAIGEDMSEEKALIEDNILNAIDVKDSKEYKEKGIDKTKLDVEKIVWLREVGSENSVYGGKAISLSILSKKYSVPDGFCVVTNVFEKMTQSKEIEALCIKLKENCENIFAINKISEEIRELIIHQSFPVELEVELRANFEKLEESVLAVRSSSSLEDQREISFAGQFDTYLNIKDFEELVKAIKKCWASFFNTRAIVYRFENNIKNEDIMMSVVVQKMIESKFSGVMFTSNIDSSKTLLIEAVPGMCENLALGKMIPNSYALSRENLIIFERIEEFEFNDEVVQKIASKGLEIEKDFAQPQDIEWCIDKDDKIWILQARPITASKNKCSIEL
ncbi:MAG: PEP/pyruvate-binding domain-containing protein [Patescibacteria group bacterium]|nr:PEP/pyruvate-binding domain-containing protein [Patescibacteria group bacterium]